MVAPTNSQPKLGRYSGEKGGDGRGGRMGGMGGGRGVDWGGCGAGDNIESYSWEIGR